MEHSYEVQDRPGPPGRRTLVLCFDGTGNKFQGNGGDSNSEPDLVKCETLRTLIIGIPVIKIFSMLDRQHKDLQGYYQPGIGTYVNSAQFSHTGIIARTKSWYTKAKDSAIGTSFEQHVMAGYKFLMRFYRPGDDIYFFGFSRGAYTARFLAQMLDYVGLLSPGNEELLRFAWKTFSSWQTRQGSTEEAKGKKHETYQFMQKFRDTFSIPVRRIRFLGLFDTVNSVPRFEAAWMQRSKFPYTAKSSAKVIRHAVSIDERRAKFRQDLISQRRPQPQNQGHRHPHLHLHRHRDLAKETNGADDTSPERDVAQSTHARSLETAGDHLALPDRRMGRSATPSTSSLRSVNSQTAAREKVQFAQEGDDVGDQDIEEVWFPGCHADIGGGWPLEKDESVSISHAPLIWMLREARRAGLKFDEDALRAAHYAIDEDLDGIYHDAPESQQRMHSQQRLPVLEVEGQIMPQSPKADPRSAEQKAAFESMLMRGIQQGCSHDVLQFKNGAPATGVVSWNIMEYLPFRRMDLQSDGSWAPIRWPLPRGETRDIPADAWIHNSAFRRMEANPTYRPGNLIVGGGGRGMRRAPESVGMGKWRVLRDEGDLVGEILVRAERAGSITALEK